MKKETILETTYTETKYKEETIKKFKKYPFSLEGEKNFKTSSASTNNNGVYWVCTGNKLNIWTDGVDKSLNIPYETEGKSHICIFKNDSSSIGLLVVSFSGEYVFWPTIEDLTENKDNLEIELNMIKGITESKNGICYTFTDTDLYQFKVNGGKISHQKVEKSLGLFSWIPFIRSKREIQHVHLGLEGLYVITQDYFEIWTFLGVFKSEIPLTLLYETLGRNVKVIGIGSFKKTAYILTNYIEDKKKYYQLWRHENYSFKRYFIENYNPEEEENNRFFGIFPEEEKVHLLWSNIYITFSKKHFEKFEINSIGGGLTNNGFIIFGYNSLLLKESKKIQIEKGRMIFEEKHNEKYNNILYNSFIQNISGLPFEGEIKVSKESMIYAAKMIIDKNIEGSKIRSLILQKLFKKEKVWDDYLEFLKENLPSFEFIPKKEFYDLETKLKFAIKLRNLSFIGTLNETFKNLLEKAIEEKEKNSKFPIDDFYKNISNIQELFKHLKVNDENSAYIVGKIYEMMIEIVKDKKYQNQKLWSIEMRYTLYNHIECLAEYLNQKTEYTLYEMVDYFLYSCVIEKDVNRDIYKNELIAYFNGDSAINLSKKYHAYKILIQNSEMDQINKYLNENQSEEFLKELFEELSLKGRVSDLLDVGLRYPIEFENLIGENHRYKWLFNIQTENYSKAEESLTFLAEEEKSIDQKRKYLSLAKLSSIIDGDRSKNLSYIEKYLQIYNWQKRLYEGGLIKTLEKVNLTELIKASIKPVLFQKYSATIYHERATMALNLFDLLEQKDDDLLIEIYHYGFNISFDLLQSNFKLLPDSEKIFLVTDSIFYYLASENFTKSKNSKLTNRICRKLKEKNSKYSEVLTVFWEIFNEEIY